MININEKELLNNLLGDFVVINQWFPQCIENCAILNNKIETILNMIEVEYCGQRGGNYYKNPLPKDVASGFKMYDRFLKIVLKNKLENELNYQGVTVWKLRDWYKNFKEFKSNI